MPISELLAGLTTKLAGPPIAASAAMGLTLAVARPPAADWVPTTVSGDPQNPSARVL